MKNLLLFIVLGLVSYSISSKQREQETTIPTESTAESVKQKERKMSDLVVAPAPPLINDR